MFNKSKKLNKPFDKKILAEAKKAVDKYEIILTHANNEWYGKILEIPTVLGDGKTPDKCIKNTKEAMEAVLAHLLEKGNVIPIPACEGIRTEQVNIRLTIEEKTILDAAAHSQGYKGLGDFIRSRALAPQYT